MKKMTEANLKAAFAGESQARMKYIAFAAKADKEGYPETARLFRAIAYAEEVHAINHLKVLGGVRKTVANLQSAMDGENYEIDEMYPAFKAVAELQGENAAIRSNDWAMEAEKVHAEMYDAAKETVETNKDVKVGQVYVCSVCGWTGEGEPPDECPLCKAKKDKFVTF
ncbi:MAG: rubrerythrin family protein [Chloroflexota bacterium]|nr:MAG: rubrerythrin family protein [Chloroflexota bacterium]